MDSLWPRLAGAALREDPFPRWMLDEALDPVFYRRLLAEWPPDEIFVRGRRLGGATKIPLSAETLIHNPSVTPLWRDFLLRHREPAFLRHLLQHFREWILRAHPDLEEKFGPAGKWRIGARSRDSFDNHDVLVDCQLAIFTPAQGRPQSDRGPHVKLRNKLMTGFLFFPVENEPSGLGGDWDFFSAPPDQRLRHGINLTVDPAQVRLADTIPYRPNTFGMLLNCPRGIQGFRPRTPGAPPFRYFEFTVQFPRRLFEVEESFVSNLRNHWRTWTRAGVTDL
ncbi:MAG: hypothetical protein JNK87_12775 [Bryobacterales bacterium]|nr:hypothetical protein [Bryobacterales bacterium]